MSLMNTELSNNSSCTIAGVLRVPATDYASVATRASCAGFDSRCRDITERKVKKLPCNTRMPQVLTSDKCCNAALLLGQQIYPEINDPSVIYIDSRGTAKLALSVDAGLCKITVATSKAISLAALRGRALRASPSPS